MKIRKRTLLLAAMLPWCAWATGEPSDYNKKNKTVTIKTVADLTWLSEQVGGGNDFQDWTITLGNDLNMNSVESFTPIGTISKKFNGVFDGNSKTISNLVINATTLEGVGLFRVIDEQGEVKDLVLDVSCSITGKNSTGSIAGKNGGKICNCVNNGTVINSSYGSSLYGGIAGSSSGSIEDCVNNGRMVINDAVYTVGGIVGSNTGTVSGCTNNAVVSGKYNIGGIVGNLSSGGKILYCVNNGNVNAKEGYAGGILGWGIGASPSVYDIKESKAVHCFSSGNVSTEGKKDNDYYYTGAIIGCNGSFMSTTDCYYAPNVTVTVNGTDYTYQSTGGCGAGENEAPKDTDEGAVTYCSISLTPTEVSNTYWTTYYNGVCSMKVVDNTTTKVYAATRNGETLTLKKVTDGIINKGQGVILKSTASSIAMTSTSDMSAGNAFTGNVLSGVDEETTQTSGNTYYVLSKGSANEVGFYKYSSTSTLAAHKAFMAVQGEQGIRSFVFEDDAAGIRQVEAKEQQGTPRVYDLQGRSVPTMKKGIYVVNSKKIWNR